MTKAEMLELVSELSHAATANLLETHREFFAEDFPDGDTNDEREESLHSWERRVAKWEEIIGHLSRVHFLLMVGDIDY